jgi:hypothetical protein
MKRILNQRARLQLLLVYVLMFLILSRVATGGWFPAWDYSGLWFYSGVFAFLTGALIEAPTHVVPKQGLLFATLAFLATCGFGFATWDILTPLGLTVWAGAVVFSAILIAIAATAIFWKDHTSDSRRGFTAHVAYELTRHLAKPAVVSAGPFIFAIVAYHVADPIEALVLTSGWAFLVFGHPLESIIHLATSISSLRRETKDTSYLGDVVGHAVPGIVTISHRGRASVTPGTPLIVRGDDGDANVAIALGYVGISDGLWLRALQLGLEQNDRQLIRAGQLVEGACSVLHDGALMRSLKTDPAGIMVRRDSLVGLVSAASNTRVLRFELIRDDAEVKEGQLVEAKIGSRQVLFQIPRIIHHRVAGGWGRHEKPIAHLLIPQ